MIINHNLLAEGGLEEIAGHVPLLGVASLGVEGTLDIGVVDLADLVEVEGVDLAGITTAITHGGVGLLQLVHLFLDLGLQILELGAEIGEGTGEEDTWSAGLDDVRDAISQGVHQLLDELAVHGVDLQPVLDHGALALLERQRQPRDVIQGETESTAHIEITLLGELTTVQCLADHNHHTVELNLDPELDAVQQSGLLGEEIFVQDGEGAGVISVGVDAVQGLVEGKFTVGGERVLGTFKIVSSSDALQITGETAVTTGIVPGDDVLAEGGQAGTVGVDGDGADPDGVDAISFGGGHSVNTKVVVGEGHIATFHGRGQVHSISQTGTKHRVHFVGDVLDALEGLQLGGEGTEITEGGVGETGRGENVGEGDIKLVGDIFIVGQDPAGQIANLGGGALTTQNKMKWRKSFS